MSPVSPRTFDFRFPQATPSGTFYELVATQPTLDYSAFANTHKRLLRDPSSIGDILTTETTRELFILGFQEQASSIVAFYERLSPHFTNNPSQNVILAKSLIEGLLLPLFVDEYQDIFIHDEMRQLITISLQSYYDCGIFCSPGLVAQIVMKLTMFPVMRLLERFIAHPESGKLLVTLVGDRRFGTSLFEHGHSTLLAWIERLIQLSDCGFDHGIAKPMWKWRALGTLKSTYPQTTALTPASEGFHVQKRVNMMNLRKLSEDERWSGEAGDLCEDVEELMVSQSIQTIFQDFGENIPKTLAAARSTVQRLEEREAFWIFEAIVRSFPCSNCCKAPLKGRRQSKDKNFIDDFRELYPELEESYTDGRQFYRAELKHLGLWRIVLSRQAMKDFSDARRSGQFAAVESKLRELATGNWNKRKGLAKPHINPEWKIPIQKAVYDDNGRIIWHIYLSLDEIGNSATQVILVRRIGDHKKVAQSEAVILRHQKTFGKEFIEACKIRDEDRDTGGFVPQRFATEVLEEESITTSLSLEESLDLHNAVITGKFYTLTQNVLDGILASGTSAEFPFDVAHDEVEIIRQTSSASFILGRSGTGKTTCLAFKLVSNYIGSRAESDRVLSVDRKPIRQVFLTRSEILAGKLNRYIRRLVSCQLSRFDSGDNDNNGPERFEEGDEDTGDCDLWSLKDEDFPLVCTFDKLLSMVEIGLKKYCRTHWKASEPCGSGTQMQRRRSSVNAVPTRPPGEVVAKTFIDHYWPKFPAHIKLGVPVDLVFSEIMGIIKGSTSALPGRNLRALTREEYLNKSFRVAPNFTSEMERDQVYTIYEHYERLKAKYHDWDGVDRTREVFVQLQKNPAIVPKLKEVVEEIYVDEIQDQRLLEIEFLLALASNPRGVHLAGDSAQCISRDSTFRFSDIKALFYDAFHRRATAMNDISLAKPKEFTLAHNYRSHQGIIALGALLIDSLWKGFPDMIDKLKPEIGKYSGPKPTFFSGFKAGDVLTRLSFGLLNRDDRLGAPEVILVRDDDALNDIEEITSETGREFHHLTILESKGMEYHDVVLLNFFSSSRHSPHYRALDKLIDSSYGYFDPKKHSVLCAELKALYVAVTRCQANLYIIEDNTSITEQIVRCWTEKVPQPLIETVHPWDSDVSEKIEILRSRRFRDEHLKEKVPQPPADRDEDALKKEETLHSVNENTAHWLENGQNLMEKRLYKQALFCFQQTPYKQRQVHAMAHLRRQEAEVSYEEELYRESAKLFLEAEHPLEASKSFEAAHLFEEAAVMWEVRRRLDKAAPLYDRARKYREASETYHRIAKYTEAAKSLRTGELYEELVQYLEKVKNVMDPVQYQRSTKLCNLLAHQGKLGSSYKNRARMLLDSDLKIEMFYRQRGYTKDLLEFFRSRGRLRDAFRYLTSIGEVEQAVLLAPFEEMKASIDTKELNQMQQLLLISDLRRTQGTHRPVYADPTHKNARPGMDKLWDALYRNLMSKTLLATVNASQQVDRDIEGFTATRGYLDLIVLEWMEEIVPRASEIMELVKGNSSKYATAELPIGSVNYDIDLLRGLHYSVNHGIDLLRDLYYAKQEAPDVLRQFIGAYQQPHRSTLLLLSTSLINNTKGKIEKQISQDGLLKSSKEWFANLVMKAAFSFLDDARGVWGSIRLGNHCVLAATNQCDALGRIRCPYNHNIITPKSYNRSFNIIHNLVLITTKLRFFYSSSLRDVIEEGLLKDFRGKQRGWLESMLKELTYISAVQQDPREIQNSPVVSYTHEEKYKAFRWLRGDLERLLVDKHVKEQWDTRNTFSELLELTQHSWQFGPRTARTVRILIKQRIDNTRRWELDPAQLAGLDLFMSRPSTNLRFYRNYHDLPALITYFNGITRLQPTQLTAFHAVISEYERIATYLLLLEGGGSAFFILTSWIAIHIPEVGTAYSTYLQKQTTTSTTLTQWTNLGGRMSHLEWSNPPKASQVARACLLSLTQSLLDLVLNICTSGNRPLFKLGGSRGTKLPIDLLLRRCVDIVWICLINIQAGHHELQGFGSQILMDCQTKLGRILPWIRNGLEIYLPPNITNEALLKNFNDSFKVYAGKESITFVQTLSNVPRFASYWPVIKECLIPVVPFATIDTKSKYDISQLNPNSQDQLEPIFSPEQVKAAEVICRIWRQYWPLYKKAKEWRSTPLGQSTIAINELCDSYKPELKDVPEVLKDLHMVFWRQGPIVYEAITTAETQSFDTAERYQQFFTSLYGTSYASEELEQVEEFFEEVENYTGKVAKMKTTFSLEGMKELFSKYQAHGPSATGGLKEHMAGMQREVTNIKDALICLGHNRFVDTIES